VQLPPRALVVVPVQVLVRAQAQILAQALQPVLPRPAQPQALLPGSFGLRVLQQQAAERVQEPELGQALQQQALMLVLAQTRQQAQSHHHSQARRWQASSFRHASIGQ